MDGLRVEHRGAALWLIIDRPESRNALTSGLLRRMTREIASGDADPAVRAIVITGTGERAFCAGADISAEGDESPFGGGGGNPLVGFLEAVGGCGAPVIARVNGAAMGGGLGLVACADLAIAADHAVFGTPEVRIGLFPMVISAHLMRLLPRRRLMELALLGERIDAAAAQACGLVNAVVPVAELDAAVSRMVESLGAGSPEAIRSGKLALARIEDLSLSEGLAHMALAIERLASTEGAAEGMAAFREKRRPAWAAEA